MDPTQLPEAVTWHYLVAEIAFMLMGVIGHVSRAVFNILPDRLSDRPVMDMMLSDGFDMQDYLLGTEYDDNGYYRLDSWKNLRIAVTTMMAGGFLAMLFAPGVSQLAALMIDASIVGLKNLFWYRLEHIRLW